MTIDTKAIRAAAEAASPGPWEAAGPSFGAPLPKCLNCVGRINEDEMFEDVCVSPFEEDDACSADMNFIATANPSTIIALLDRLKADEVEVIEQARLLGISAEKELALMAKLEAAEKDAARYRHLFAGDKVYTQFREAYDFWDGLGGKDGFDAVVDSAIKGDL